jgi:hypothetical protein
MAFRGQEKATAGNVAARLHQIQSEDSTTSTRKSLRTRVDASIVPSHRQEVDPSLL